MSTLIFSLAGKEYGLDIAHVREVIRLRPITPVPDTADFVEGVISLHGKVVPLVNLRVKLGMDKKLVSKSDRIIVTRSQSHTVGVIVDGLVDVILMKKEDIAPPDEVLKDAAYLTGVARIGKRMILVVDMDTLLKQDIGPSIDRIHQKVEIRKR